MPKKSTSNEWTCPQCGGDIMDECEKFVSSKFSSARKEYWKNPAPGHREAMQDVAKKARAVANADPEVCRRRGKKLFASVPRETRLEYLKRANAVLADKRADIVAEIKSRPSFKQHMANLRDITRENAASKRLDEIKSSCGVSHEHPIFLFRFNRAKVDRMMNVSSFEDVMLEIGTVRQIDGMEAFAVWHKNLHLVSVYVNFNGKNYLLGDVYGFDESFTDNFPAIIEYRD